MRLSGFTRIGAMIGFFGAIALMLISAIQFDSDEVSRKDVILAEVLIGLPVFTMLGAAVGAGWDFFEKRTARARESPTGESSQHSEIETPPTSATPANPPRRRRRNPPGGRRRR